MTEWTSLSVTEEQKERLKDEKPDGMAMGKWLIQEVIDSNSNDRGVSLDPQEFEAKMKERNREVLGRIDDLESQLPAKVAEELR